MFCRLVNIRFNEEINQDPEMNEKELETAINKSDAEDERIPENTHEDIEDDTN